MSEKYYFNEKRDKYSYHEVLIDIVTMLEDRLTKYSRGFGPSSKAIFAYKDAIETVRKIERIYIEKGEAKATRLAKKET